MKTALIFGVTGQDGSYLAELLLGKSYKVYGVARRVSSGQANLERVNHIKDENLIITEGDVTDPHSVNSILSLAHPDEVYNLAAQSHVHTSFSQPAYTWNATAVGALNILEGIRQRFPKTKYYQAGSSEMFGASRGTEVVENGVARHKQNEATPFAPCSPYGVAKLAAHHITKVYREGYGIFASNGILFNHESPRRCDTFLTKKVCKYVAKVSKEGADKVEPLKLGNLLAYRDWGWAPDFVRAMWLMLQQDKPDDYVIATGETHTVKDFLVTAFQHGLGYYSDRLVQTDPALYRAVEVNYLCGDYSKAKAQLGWEPQVSFNDIVLNMVNAEKTGNGYY